MLISRPKVMTVYGTRPEAIKMAPVIKELQGSDLFDVVVAVTGQHRSMLDQVNNLFAITPQIDLDIFAHSLSLAQIMARVLEELDTILEEISPDVVIVQGDTSTSTAAALAAFYRQIPVVHLEAGLRSGSLASPFPEEANRCITTQVSTLHLAPTKESRQNLLREGIPSKDIIITGNSVIDALLSAVEKKPKFTNPVLESLVSSDNPILLVTTHRRENWGAAMEATAEAIVRLAKSYPRLRIVVPLHQNPIVRDALLPKFADVSSITVTDPLPYGEFTRLMQESHIILTDSGGVQEEAPSLGKPVLVMRENTERPEAVKAGTVKVIGVNRDRIFTEVSKLLDDESMYQAMANAVNPYGDGQSAKRIVAAVSELFGLGNRLDDFKPALESA